MRRSVKVLNDFNTLTLKEIFWKTETFFKTLEYRFLVESTKIENALFPCKTANQKPMLRQIECWVQYGAVTKNRVFPVATLICFTLRTSSKELIWCINDPNVHIRTLCKHWSFIWWYFFPLSILNEISIILVCFEVNKPHRKKEKNQSFMLRGFKRESFLWYKRWQQIGYKNKIFLGWISLNLLVKDFVKQNKYHTAAYKTHKCRRIQIYSHFLKKSS